MGTEFDPAKENKFISYLEANKLYGWAMSNQLSTSGFEWITDHKLDDWKHLSCFLEFDLEYPEHLHDLHNDYSLTSERVEIGDVKKIIPNLNNNTNYVVHYEILNYTKAPVYKLQRFIDVLNSMKVPGRKNALIYTRS